MHQSPLSRDLHLTQANSYLTRLYAIRPSRRMPKFRRLSPSSPRPFNSC